MPLFSETISFDNWPVQEGPGGSVRVCEGLRGSRRVKTSLTNLHVSWRVHKAASGFPPFQSLEHYLSDDQFLNSDKRTVILAYKHMGKFLIKRFWIIYGSSSKVYLQDKTSWCDDVKQKIDFVDGDLDRFCLAVKQLTAANAAYAMDDPANVTFQPEGTETDKALKHFQPIEYRRVRSIGSKDWNRDS